MFVMAFSAVPCTHEVEALLCWQRSVFEGLLAASELGLLAIAFVEEGVLTGIRGAGSSGRSARLPVRNATFLFFVANASQHEF